MQTTYETFKSQIFYSSVPLRSNILYCPRPLRSKILYCAVPLRSKIVYCPRPLRSKILYSPVPLRSKTISLKGASLVALYLPRGRHRHEAVQSRQVFDRARKQRPGKEPTEPETLLLEYGHGPVHGLNTNEVLA